MTAIHAIKSVDDMRGIPTPTPQFDLHLDRAIRQIHVLRSRARHVPPRRAAPLEGAAWAIESSVRDLEETLGGGDDKAICAALIRVRCTHLAARLFVGRLAGWAA